MGFVASALGEQFDKIKKLLKKHRLTPSGVPCFVKGTTAKQLNRPKFFKACKAPPQFLESFAKKVRFLKKLAGGRIFDEKAGLRRLLCGDKTWVSIAQAKGKLPALSQKANARKDKNDYKLRNPKI